jgi:hypothetical protein
VQTGDNVLIGGFIITGTVNKKVIVRAIGPSLTAAGVPGALPNPKLELHNGGGALIGFNDDWKTTIAGGVITGDQRAQIEASTLAPADDHESAIIATLAPANYTAIVRGVGDGTGVGLAEVYDLNAPANAQLANLSTRGFVQTSDDVMIGGFIVGGSPGGRAKLLVRAIGPSLGNAGVPDFLIDPTLQLFNASGTLVDANDNWKSDHQAEIEATTLPPTKDAESAIVQTLAPGNYTAIVKGVGDTTGVGLVEVYNLQ